MKLSPGRSTLVFRFLVWLVPVAALLVAYAAGLYRRELDAERRIHEQESLRVIDVGAEVVARDLQSVIADLRYLAAQSTLRDYVAGRPRARGRLELDFQAFCRHKETYDQVRFLDRGGMEVVRVNYHRDMPFVVPENELQPKSERPYFASAMALEAGRVFVSPFDLNVEHGEIERPLKPVIRFATPVFEGNSVAGVLVLNYLGQRLIDRLREISSGSSGEVALVDGDGFYVLHPRSPEAEWGRRLGHGVTFSQDHPLAWQSISNGPAGQFLASDGLFTFRRVGHEAGLVLVSRLAMEQLTAGADSLLRQVLSIYLLAAPVLFGLIAYLVHAGAVRQRHNRQIAESESRLRSLSAQLLTTQERERASVSRDLHDDLGQVITTVRLDLERALQATDPREREQLVRLALEVSDTLMRRVRAISTQLRPRILDDLGLKDATRSFLVECQDNLDLEPAMNLRFEREDIPADISENVFRLLQEAVTNVAKHSQTRKLSVDLIATESGVHLRVGDAGVGFDPQSTDGTGLGLAGMRERTRLLGGTFRLRSRPGSGTVIDVFLPLRPRAETGRS